MYVLESISLVHAWFRVSGLGFLVRAWFRVSMHAWFRVSGFKPLSPSPPVHGCQLPYLVRPLCVPCALVGFFLVSVRSRARALSLLYVHENGMRSRSRSLARALSLSLYVHENGIVACSDVSCA